MNGRNTSPYEMFLALARSRRPRHHFRPSFIDWREAALPAVVDTLGTPPVPVDPDPQLVVEFPHGGLLCQRWLIDVCPGLSAVLCVNRPADAHAPRPAILCWHGHNPYGKEPVMGNDSSPALRDVAATTGTDYGRRLAEAGFVTFAIDWMGRGDFDDGAKPHHRSVARGRDWCNLYYLHATMLGMTPLGLNTAFGKVAADVVMGLPYVAGERFGVVGESGGGTFALWSGLTDPRITAVEVSCYSDLFRDFAYRDLNYCGSQITPGLFTLVDLPDLQGLLAPRPLLVDIGAYDECFRVESAMECYRQVEMIYAAAGAQESLQLDLYPGGHGWPGTSSVAFFAEHVGAPAPV